MTAGIGSSLFQIRCHSQATATAAATLEAFALSFLITIMPQQPAEGDTPSNSNNGGNGDNNLNVSNADPAADATNDADEEAAEEVAEADDATNNRAENQDTPPP